MPFLAYLYSSFDNKSLLPLEFVLLYSEGHLQKFLLLFDVRRLQTSGDGCARVAARVHDVLAVVVLGLVQQSLDARLSKAPSTSVQRFFLGPDNRLGIRVAVQVFLELLPREGVELLNTCNGDIVNLVFGTVLVQRSIDLTCAKNDTRDFLARLDVLGLVSWVLDDPVELRITSKLLNVGARKRVAEERLGEEDDEGYNVLAGIF